MNDYIRNNLHEKDSECDKYYRISRTAESKDVLLAFSAVGVSAGKFNGSRALSQFPVNIIYLNCDRNWYLNGVPGLGSTLEETIESLKEIIYSLAKNEGRVIAYGGSMGGYGAVLYACLLEAEMAIATGVEFCLLIEGGATFGLLDNHVDIERIRSVDLAKIVQSSRTQIYLYYGENYYSDLICGLKVSTLNNVSIATLRNFSHSLPPYIQSSYGLTKFIQYHLDHRALYPFGENIVGDLLNYPTLIKNLHSIKNKPHLLEKDEVDYLREQFQEYIDPKRYSNNVVGQASFGLSTLHSSFFSLETAIIYAQQATDFMPSNIYCWLNLARLLFEAKNYKASILAASKAIKYENPNINLDACEAYFLKAEALSVLGKHKTSFNFINRAEKKYLRKGRSEQRRRNRINLFRLEHSRQTMVRILESQNVSVDFSIIEDRDGHFEVSKFDHQTRMIAKDSVDLTFGGLLLSKNSNRIIKRIIAIQSGKVISHAQMNLRSPRLARKYPDNPSSYRARFFIKLKEFAFEKKIYLCSIFNDKERVMIATIYLPLSF